MIFHCLQELFTLILELSMHSLSNLRSLCYPIVIIFNSNINEKSLKFCYKLPPKLKQAQTVLVNVLQL